MEFIIYFILMEGRCMCELFSISSKKDMLINEYLINFYSHCNQHPHGWGFARFFDEQIELFKGPEKATESTELNEILSKQILAQNAFAHIRLATTGITNISNCHPFTKSDDNGRQWTLMHNGTIFNCEVLDKYVNIQEGQTDSERMLYYIIDQINKIEHQNEKILSEEELFNLINDIIINLSEANKLNIMIYDGNLMYIHINKKDSLYSLNYDDSLIFATTPVSEDNWTSVNINTVYAVKDGQIIYQGSRHEHEYVLSEDNLDFIYHRLSKEQKQNIIDKYGSYENMKMEIFKNKKDSNLY